MVTFMNWHRIGALWTALMITTIVTTGRPVSADDSRRDPGEERAPNVIVILCDNLGYGDTEPFGSTLHRTPNLQRMAREGMRLTHFYATAGVCTASRSSFMTGCYAQRVGMHFNDRDGLVLRPLSPYGLNPREETVAEVLQRAGYATALIGKWHLGDQLPFLPTRQGFEHFLGIPYSDDMTRDVGLRLADRYDGSSWPPLPLMRDESVIDAPVDRRVLTSRYTQESIGFIRKNQQRPFFLFLSHATPGSTRTPFVGPEFQGHSRNGPWGDSVEELDWSTGQILNEVVELGLDRNTLVLWTSDNGAPLARDPKLPDRGVNRPLGGRGYTTAEGGFRVPAIAWWPGHVPAGRTCGELTTAMDLLPTCASLAHGRLPSESIDGHDMTPLLLGQPAAKSAYDVFYYYYCQQLQAVRSGPWKLFVPLDTFVRHPYYRKGRANGPLLFDVVEDIRSSNNVAAEHPQVVARLLKLADGAREILGDTGRRGSQQRPPGRIEHPIARRRQRP